MDTISSTMYCASETIAALLRQAHDEAIDRQQREDAEPINWKPKPTQPEPN